MPAAGREPQFPSFRPTVASLIRHQAAAHGDRVLAVLGDERLTYAAAEARSARLARGLLATGVTKGSRVGILAPNGPTWILTWLAVNRIGAVAVMANTYHRPRELGWLLRHGDVSVLCMVASFLDHDYLARLEAVASELHAADRDAGPLFIEALPNLRTVWVWGDHERMWAGHAPRDLEAAAGRVDEAFLTAVEDEVTPADPALVAYSSGSTAEPKGAIHTQGALVRHAYNLWQFRELGADDVIYTPMPLFWVGGLSFALMAALHAGARLVFEERFDPAVTLELLEREQATIVLGWPHMGKALTTHPDFARRDLSSIRSGSLPELVADGSQPTDPGLRISSLGMTETLGPHLLGDMGTELPEEKRGSFGFSAPGVEHKVVDPLTGEDCPVGTSGELWVRGYSVMAGLHRRERAETFTPDGWYRTGDGGHFDTDGHFYFTGRMGDLIKSSGMNVTPREVEIVLEEHPDVTAAHVRGIPHTDRGEDIAAAVVVRPDANVSPDSLVAFTKERLASYKVPRHIALFTSPQDLPWLDSGKIDGRKLAAMLEERFAG